MAGILAISGNTIAVGEPGYSVGTDGSDPEQGAVYVLSNASGSWVQTAMLTASDAAPYDAFGESVAISGTTIAVGAENNTHGNTQYAGAVYAFSDASGSWQQTGELTVPTDPYAELGYAVAVSGNTIAADAPYGGGLAVAHGTVYMWQGNSAGGGWTQTAKLQSSDGGHDDAFGWALAMSGSTLVASGIPAYPAPAADEVYVFTKSTTGTWAQTAELTAGVYGDQFGTSLAVSGNTIVGGARYETVGANSGQGAAYVFSNSSGTWSPPTELTASDGGASDNLGYSVAVSGSTIVAGAPYHTVGGNDAAGAAYDFAIAPTLTVTVRLTNGKSTVALGASVPVSVTVTAGAGNSGNISDLAWSSVTPGGLGITPAGAASVTTALAPSLPSQLAPGQSVVLNGTIKAGTKSVTASLASTVTGEDADDQPVSATGNLPIVIGATPLTMTVQTIVPDERTPGEVHLDVDDDGVITPKKVTVKVTFTNTTTKPMSGVRLIALQPSPQDPTQQLDKLGFPSSVIPAKVPDIPAKKSVAKTFRLEVTGDGTYVIRATAIFPDPSAKGGNGRASATGGTFKSIVPFFYFKASIDASNTSSRGGSRWVTGGDSWYVKARLRNLSSYQSLCLPPLVVSTTGNADALGLEDIATSDPTSVDPPLAGLIEPGASYSLLMLVTTSSVSSTRGEVKVPTDVFKTVPGSSCEVQDDGSMSGAGDRLTTAQTHIVGGSTDFTVHVDVSVNDDTSYVSNGIAFFGGFAKGTILGFAGFAHGIFAMMKQCSASYQEYGQDITAIAGVNPVRAVELFARANARIDAMTDLMVNYLQTATPEEKQHVGTQVASAFRRAGNDAYNNVAAKYEAVSNAWFGDITAAEQSGNADDVWRAWGEADGNFSSNVVLQVLVAVLGKQMAGELPQMQARSAAATGEGSELTTMKGGTVVAGRAVTLAEEQAAVGVTAEQDASLGAIAKRFNILIGVRSRQAISVALEKLGALWKNSNFHQKTISLIDSGYLSFPEADQGLLGWRSFTPAGKAAAERKIIFSDLTSSQRTEAFGRLDARIAENGSDLKKVNSLLNTQRNGVKGWVNAGFNATESGRATSSVSRWRRFAVVETEVTDGSGANLGTYSKPYQESINFPPGSAIPPLCSRSIIVGVVMCPITGDLDLSYITTVYGSGLPSEKMLEVFAALEKAGFAHTDLVTWIDQQTGKAMFPGKLKQLKDIAVGGESVLQFAPDPIRRATYLDLAKSIITGPNDYSLAIKGTYVPEMK